MREGARARCFAVAFGGGECSACCRRHGVSQLGRGVQVSSSQGTLDLGQAGAGEAAGVASERCDPASRGTARDELVGSIEKVVYHNPENGYFVVRLAVAGARELATVVGYSMQIAAGERLIVRGAWVKTEKYGRQFKAAQVTRETPQDGAGLAKYLAHALEGVGPELASRLVARFGAGLTEIIEKSPERLAEVEGVGRKRIAAIVEAWRAKADEAKSLAWLCGIGLSVKQAKVALALYGDRTRAALEANPYRLADDVSGLGFLKVDAIARRLGIDAESEERVEAAVLFCVGQAVDAGSCGVGADEAARQALKILKFSENAESVERIRTAIKRLAESERIVVDWSGEDVCLFPRWLYETERSVGGLLIRRRDEPSFVRVEDVPAAVAEAEGRLGITLEPRQRDAVRVALSSNVMVITGGPGTGKTTITRAIVRAFERVVLRTADGAARRAKVLVCAPTGKAAKRAGEAIGCQALTVHRALEWGPGGPKRDADHPMEEDVFIVDEMSMLDAPLMLSLLSAIPPGARVIFVGDRDQLPSVGPGRVLSDMIESGAIPVAKLEVVFRQSATSKIIVNAHAVNSGKLPWQGIEGVQNGAEVFRRLRALGEEPAAARKVAWRMVPQAVREAMLAEGTAVPSLLSDFGFLVEPDTDKARERLLALVAQMREWGFDPILDCQVLLPMRKGSLGTDQMNIELKRLLNSGPSQGAARRLSIPFQGGELSKGDKVIQVKNNYQKEVFNGEIGYVTEVDPRDGSCYVLYDDEKLIGYAREDLNEIRLAYALTIHKSQGSEFPVVIMGLTMQHWVMLKRNLIYTGITRAKQLMLMVGDVRAVAKAVGDDSIDERHSKLAEWLREPPQVVRGGEA